MVCFNCGTGKGVDRYSFDLDLPAIEGCRMCVWALSVGDTEMLAALKPRLRRRVRKSA